MRNDRSVHWLTWAGVSIVAAMVAVPVWSQTTRAFNSNGGGAGLSSRLGTRSPGISNAPVDLGSDDLPFTLPLVVPPQLLTSKPVAASFDLLNRRSIFRKGSQTIARPDAVTITSQPTTAPAPETSLIFNGVARANDEPVAFFEDGESHAVSILHEGDPLAQGKLQRITLDGIDYLVNGEVKHLAIGQDLEGNEKGSSLESQPTGALTGETATSPENESVLDRLRRRRLQELKR